MTERLQEEISICPRKAELRFAVVMRAPRDSVGPVGSTMDCDPDCSGPIYTSREILGFKLPSVFDIADCPMEGGADTAAPETFDLVDLAEASVKPN